MHMAAAVLYPKAVPPPPSTRHCCQLLLYLVVLQPVYSVPTIFMTLPVHRLRQRVSSHPAQSLHRPSADSFRCSAQNRQLNGRIVSYILLCMAFNAGNRSLGCMQYHTTLGQMQNYHFLCWIGLNEVHSISYLSPFASPQPPAAPLSLLIHHCCFAWSADAPAATPQWLEWISVNVKRCWVICYRL